MVYIVEQEPVAFWNQDLLLNKYGGVFDAELVETELFLLVGQVEANQRYYMD